MDVIYGRYLVTLFSYYCQQIIVLLYLTPFFWVKVVFDSATVLFLAFCFVFGSPLSLAVPCSIWLSCLPLILVLLVGRIFCFSGVSRFALGIFPGSFRLRMKKILMERQVMHRHIAKGKTRRKQTRQSENREERNFCGWWTDGVHRWKK